jgi:hypothetical protein
VIANVFVLNEKLYWFIFHCCPSFGDCTSTFLRVAPFLKYAAPFFELYLYTFPSVLLQEAVSSLKTGKNHEQSMAPQAQGVICAF